MNKDEKYVLELEEEIGELKIENERLNEIINNALDFIEDASWDNWDRADYYLSKILKGETYDNNK